MAEISDVLPSLLLVADDLMVQSRVREATAPLGYQVQTVASLAAATRAFEAANPPRAVLVNLSTRRCDPTAIIVALKQLPTAPLILAFAGHVEQEKHQAARAAGADMVAANSSVALYLSALLQRLLSPKEREGDSMDA